MTAPLAEKITNSPRRRRNDLVTLSVRENRKNDGEHQGRDEDDAYCLRAGVESANDAFDGELVQEPDRYHKED